MKRHNSVASGVAWSLIRTWGSRLIGFLIYFQLARLLAPADVGLFAATFAVLSLTEMLVDMGMVQAIVQRPHVSDGLLNAVFAVNVALAVVIAICLAVMAPFLEAWVRAPGLAPVILVSSAALVFNALGMCQEALARKTMNFRLLATRTLVSTAISGALGVMMARAGYGVWSLVVQFVLASVINTSVMWFKPMWRPSRVIDTKELGSLLRFGIHVLGQRLVNYADSRGADLLIGALLGPAILGIFSIGSKLQYICLQMVGIALIDVAHPTFSRLQADLGKLREAHLTASRNVALVSMPLWGILSACAPEAVTTAFGPNWGPAAPVLQAFAWIGFFQTMSLFDVAAYNALGLPNQSLRLGLLRAIAVLTAICLTGGDSSAAQVAFSILYAQILITPYFLYVLRKNLGTSLRAWARSIAPAAVGTLILWFTVRTLSIHGNLPEHPSVRLFMLSAAGLTAYLAFLSLAARSQLQALTGSILLFQRSRNNPASAKS